MSMRSITFLGTGTSQGVPMIGCDCAVCSSADARDARLRSSVLIEYDGSVIVIDAGMDFRYQMLRERVRNLDAILLTHEHKDHIGGVDDIRAFNYFLKREVDIYAEQRVIDVVKKDFDYAFSPNRYLGVPLMVTHPIDATPFKIGELEVVPIRGLHHYLPVLGYKIGDICYITDVNYLDDSELEKIKGVDILVINALRREKHISHFTLAEALDIIAKVAPKRAYITHISHQMGLYEQVEKELPHGVHLAYDRLKITL